MVNSGLEKKVLVKVSNQLAVIHTAKGNIIVATSITHSKAAVPNSRATESFGTGPRALRLVFLASFYYRVYG